MKETIKPKDSDRPVKRMIDEAIACGYEYDETLSYEDHMHKIRSWIYDKSNIWVWVSCGMNDFTPYIMDRREIEPIKKKLAKSIYHPEAMTTALTEAFKQINNY